MRLLAALLLSAALCLAQTIVSAEYFWDTDPGYGSGTPLSIVADDSVSASADLPSLSQSGFHTLFVRYQDSTGRWSESQGRQYYYVPLANAAALDSINLATVKLNGATIRSLSLSPNDTVHFSETLETDTVTPGLQNISVIYTTESGRPSRARSSYLFVFPPDTGWNNLKIVNADLTLNDIPIGTIDLPDSSQSGHGVTLGTDTLPEGMHKLALDFRDERGLTTGNLDGYFYLFGPRSPGAPLWLTAAEYYINSDPGVGNGVPLTPDDGLYDERDEQFTDSLSGLPVGLYIAGVRVRDNRGIWSETQVDTFLIAPLLTIASSGTDIVLRWQPGDSGGAVMHIERAPSTDGPYTEIATTTDVTFTDTNILTTLDKAFYQVRQDLSALARYRLPARSGIQR
ncbi:MAG: hypothetical protein IPH10_12165 [bacterium]|nr:hypothetical protein [bacterium]